MSNIKPLLGFSKLFQSIGVMSIGRGRIVGRRSRVTIEFLVKINLLGDTQFFAAVCSQTEAAAIVTTPLTVMAVRTGMFFLFVGHTPIVRGISEWGKLAHRFRLLLSL